MAVEPIVEDSVEVVEEVVEEVEEEPPPPSPVLEVPVPVPVPAMTKIRLQEISRKMLAKRRRIIVDTQTDFYESTTRVKDVYTITDKIKQADAEVLTDEHQDLPIFPTGLINVRRVKEMATLTDKMSTTLIRSFFIFSFFQKLEIRSFKMFETFQIQRCYMCDRK